MTKPDDWRDEGLVKKPENLLSRRDFVKRTMQLAVAGTLIPGTVAQILPSIAPDTFGGGGEGPVIRRDPDTNEKIPITLSDLAGDTPFTLTAEWNFLPAAIYKVKKTILKASAEARGYNTAQFAVQHPTEPDNAILVYDAKCKHLGCTVGWNGGLGGSKDIADYNKDGVPDGRILCPCHQGQYDIYDLALNQPGTPPPQPLNVIKFRLDGDIIVGVEKFEQAKYKDANGKADVQPMTFQLATGETE